MFPEVIRIEPASSCNLKCRHCPTGTFSMPRTIMKKEIWARCLEEINKHVHDINAVVLYHGGEPLLNPRFFEMAREAKETGVRFLKTVSNGMLIRTEFYDKILTCGLDAIECSLDGTSAEENNYIRRNSDFEYVTSQIKGLLKRKEELGSDLKIFISNVQFLTKDTVHKRNNPPIIPENIKTVFSNNLEDIEFKTTWGMLWPSELPSENFDILHFPLEESPQACSLMEETFTIRADGSVVICCYDLTTISNMGNIVDSDIESIWSGKQYQVYRSNFRKGIYEKPCNTCVTTTGNKYLLRQ